MIKIIIADDHKIVLEGLISLVRDESSIEIVGEALNGKEVLEILENQEVDVAVLDIEMPEIDGVDITRIILEKYPKTKVVILTMYSDANFIRRVAEAGAHGYILKNKGREELVAAIQEVCAGGQYFSEEVTRSLIASMRNSKMSGEIKLTPREVEVLRLIAEGKSSRQISSELFIAMTTVETHRRNLIEKTGSLNSKGLIRFALENGYV